MSCVFERNFSLVVIITFSLLACQQDDEIIPELEDSISQQKTYPGVEEELWPYFRRFEDEAEVRGFSIDLNTANIRGIIEDLEEENVAGLCNYHSRLPNQVTIDEEFWERSNDLFREFVVFHELGHCHLGRDHREDQFVNGSCQSIMRSGNGDCIDNYFSRTRTLYLDELFDPQFRNEIGN